MRIVLSYKENHGASTVRFVVDEKTYLNLKEKISFLDILAVYMLHPIAIVICLQLSNHFLPFGMMGEILLVIASMLVTVLLSALSYELMEKHFLKGRKRERVIE